MSWVIPALTAGFSLLSNDAGAQAQSAMIKQRQIQNNIAEAERSIQTTEYFNKVLSAQNAIGAAHGMNESGSFAAVQLKSFENYNTTEKMDALTTQWQNNALTDQENAIWTGLAAKDISVIGGAVASYMKSSGGGDPFTTGPGAPVSIPSAVDDPGGVNAWSQGMFTSDNSKMFSF